MLAVSTLLGAVYFPTTGNLFATFCLDASEATNDDGSWGSLALAALLGAVVGAVSAAHVLEKEDSITALTAPALAECFLLGVGGTICAIVVFDGMHPFLWLSTALGTGLICACWFPLAFVRSLYFGLSARAFAACARRRTWGPVTLAVVMLAVALGLSFLSLRIMVDQPSAVFPPSLLRAVPRGWMPATGG